MVGHIVMWKMKDSAGGKTAAENAAIMKDMLSALPDGLCGRTCCQNRIPELLEHYLRHYKNCGFVLDYQDRFIPCLG